MLRLSPRLPALGQARSFDVIYGGGESNVAVSLANTGCRSSSCRACRGGKTTWAMLHPVLAQYGVGRADRARGARLGIYFMEMGACSRHRCIRVPRDSSIAHRAGHDRWRAVFADATGSTGTGITPATSKGTAPSAWKRVRTARRWG